MWIQAYLYKSINMWWWGCLWEHSVYSEDLDVNFSSASYIAGVLFFPLVLEPSGAIIPVVLIPSELFLLETDGKPQPRTGVVCAGASSCLCLCCFAIIQCLRLDIINHRNVPLTILGTAKPEVWADLVAVDGSFSASRLALSSCVFEWEKRQTSSLVLQDTNPIHEGFS